jgi:fatty acid desaturase
MRWLPTVFFNFVTYIARYTITAFYPDNTKPVLATRRPAFISGDRWRIAIELAVILAIQVCVFFAVGGRWVSYLWAGPISYLAASAVVMSYIWTNHTLNPLCEENDPLLASTTVSVPSLFNHLHSNFSFHTEHHVFPSLNSDYYPLVAKLLKEQYPDRYNEIPFGEAWRQLWLRDKFLDLNGASKCRNETYVEKEKNNDAL